MPRCAAAGRRPPARRGGDGRRTPARSPRRRRGRESWPAGPPTGRRWVHQSNGSSSPPTATRCSSSRWHAAALVGGRHGAAHRCAPAARPGRHRRPPRPPLRRCQELARARRRRRPIVHDRARRAPDGDEHATRHRARRAVAARHRARARRRQLRLRPRPDPRRRLPPPRSRPAGAPCTPRSPEHSRRSSAPEPGQIAYHLEHAGQVDAAIAAYRRAVERGAGRSPTRTSISNCRRALRLVGDPPAGPRRDDDELDLPRAARCGADGWPGHRGPRPGGLRAGTSAAQPPRPRRRPVDVAPVGERRDRAARVPHRRGSFAESLLQRGLDEHDGVLDHRRPLPRSA